MVNMNTSWSGQSSIFRAENHWWIANGGSLRTRSPQSIPIQLLPVCGDLASRRYKRFEYTLVHRVISREISWRQSICANSWGGIPGPGWTTEANWNPEKLYCFRRWDRAQAVVLSRRHWCEFASLALASGVSVWGLQHTHRGQTPTRRALLLHARTG